VNDQCCHQPPQTCAYCGDPVVVSVDRIGACAAHIDHVFADVAGPLTALLAAAIEAFGDGTVSDARP
jgi:hypothetical protein